MTRPGSGSPSAQRRWCACWSHGSHCRRLCSSPCCPSSPPRFQLVPARLCTVTLLPHCLRLILTSAECWAPTQKGKSWSQRSDLAFLHLAYQWPEALGSAVSLGHRIGNNSLRLSSQSVVTTGSASRPCCLVSSVLRRAVGPTTKLENARGCQPFPHFALPAGLSLALVSQLQSACVPCFSLCCPAGTRHNARGTMKVCPDGRQAGSRFTHCTPTLLRGAGIPRVYLLTGFR